MSKVTSEAKPQQLSCLQSLSLEKQGRGASELVNDLLKQLPANAQLLRLTTFALDSAEEENCRQVLLNAGHNCPLAWLLDPQGPGGLQTQYVVDAELHPIILDGQLAGHVFEDELASYCVLGGLHAPADVSQAEQTRLVYKEMQQALKKANMDFSHIARTWFYLEDILSWYDEFNEVRSGLFDEYEIFGKCVPASTGIGAGNSRGSALMVDIIAIAPKSQYLSYGEVPSPLQCSALDYGSSFSRALEICSPDAKQLLISGTASIEPGGETIHLDDCEAQIGETLKVVQAILYSRGMNWNEVDRGIIYFRHAKDLPLYDKVRRQMGLPQLPLIETALTVCRDDLLFEIEVDAFQGERA